jgi:DNA-binding NtrC family response regulator
VIRVLIVEDDAPTRELYEEVLAKSQRIVVAVGTAEAAIRAFADTLPDAVVCDLGLPGTDGLSLLRLLRQVDPDVPLVVCTGSPIGLTAVESGDLGILLCLRKPVKLDVLREAVDRAASLSRRIVDLRRDLMDARGIQ